MCKANMKRVRPSDTVAAMKIARRKHWGSAGPFPAAPQMTELDKEKARYDFTRKLVGDPKGVSVQFRQK